MRRLEHVFRLAHEFELIHFHTDYMHFPLSRRHHITRLTTLHGRLDIPDLVPLYREFPDEPVVSISDAQRRPLPWIGWVGMVHHGLPRGLFRLGTGQDGYLAGIPLKLAAKLEGVDRRYFESTVESLLDPPFIEWIGEIGEAEKNEFLGAARALLFPIDWEEPFGLVMIEAMACGTPVIALRRGSVPEVMVEGVTGYCVDTVEEAVEATLRAGARDRARCRDVFERRFTADRMAADYLRLYTRLLAATAEGTSPSALARS